MKIGVFLARMQPLHNAHMFMVEKACLENEKVIVMLGSSNKRDMLRNPFDIELRAEMLKTAVEESIGIEEANKVEVYEIPDWSQEGDLEGAKEWGSYFYYNVVSRAHQKTFSIYYNDEPSIMLNWFYDYIETRIDFKFMERSSMFEGLSATKIRNAFSDYDEDYVREYCPDVIVRNYDKLRDIWTGVIANPQEDFSME